MLAKAPGLPRRRDRRSTSRTRSRRARRTRRARAVVAALAEPAWRGVTCSVRVNAPRTPWCHLDIAALGALAARPPASIVVPKVESAGDLAFVDRLLDGVEAAGGRARPMRVQALIETAAGLARVAGDRGGVAAAGRADPRLRRPRRVARPRRGRARPRRVAPGAGPDPARRADARPRRRSTGRTSGSPSTTAFTAAVARARDLGFDGKWAIHPAQVAALNARVHADARRRSTRARAVIAALGGERSSGAVALDGQMLDEAVRVAALRTLARAGEARDDDGDACGSPARTSTSSSAATSSAARRR